MSEKTEIVLFGNGIIGKEISKQLYLSLKSFNHYSRNATNHVQALTWHELKFKENIIIWCLNDTQQVSMSYGYFEYLVEIISINRPKYVIYFSSGGAVYGNATKFPIIESIYPAPITEYGKIKLKNEIKLQSLANELGFSLLILRPSNVYGLQHNETGIIAAIVNSLQEQTPLTLVNRGNAVRDFVSVSDIAQATLSLININAEGIFNIGTGTGIQIIQLIQFFNSISGKKIEIAFQVEAQEVEKSILDSSKLKSLVDWSPILFSRDTVRTILKNYDLI